MLHRCRFVACSHSAVVFLQKMPLLRELKLNNSALNSVRDLGSRLRHLQVISLNACCFCSETATVTTACCYAAGTMGVTLWPHRVRWAECFAKPEGAVRSFQPDREFGANCRQASHF